MFLLGLPIFALFSVTLGFLKDEEYRKLPPLYIYDDLNYCRKIQGKFCLVKVTFQPLNYTQPSQVWKLMEETDKESYYFNHKEILRPSCFPTGPEYDAPKLERDLKINYSSDGLLPKIDVLRCTRDVKNIRIVDVLPLLIGLTLVILMLWATYIDLTGNKESNKKNKVLMAFSLHANWTNTTTKKFGFVQGLRTCTMLCIILIHSFVLYVSLYTENPVFIEKLLSKPFVLAWFGLSNFFVQTFFILSAIFLGRHILDLYLANREFTLKDVVFMILNRYLRLVPQQFLMVFSYCTNIGPLIGNGLLQEMIEGEVDICKQNWPWALFFLNNISPDIKMCSPLSWYLAVDFQMYVIVTIICYVCLRYKMNLYRSLISLSVLILAWNIILHYVKKYPVLPHISPRSFLMGNQLRHPMFLNLYMSTYSNAAAYIFATCFGFATMTYNKAKIFENKFIYFVWFILSHGLPLAALHLSRMQIKEPTTVAVLSATVKPIYALGFCLLVAGMMIQPNTKLHELYSWRPLVFLGSFTYSTYMFHFGGLLMKWMRITKPVYLTSIYMIQNTVLDIVSSFFVGGIMFFLLEKPMGNLQSMFVPNVKKQQLKK